MRYRKPIRVYADTSVYGGAYDPEFQAATKIFFRQVHRGEFRLVTSALIEEELSPVPAPVRRFYRKWRDSTEQARISGAMLSLRAAYVGEGIVGEKSAADALHVAIATVRRCPVLVSWNCRHIVHFRKIPMYNAVNRLMGYGELAIHTPTEVVADEDEPQEF